MTSKGNINLWFITLYARLTNNFITHHSNKKNNNPATYYKKPAYNI